MRTAYLVLSFLVCITQQSRADDWRSTFHTGHPLNGLIWHSASQQFVSREQLLDELQQQPLILLGEKHDNPDHHRLRLALLESLAETRKPSVLAMEMLDSGQQTLLATLTTADAQQSNLKDRLDWDEGWQWEFYRPAIQWALGSNIPLAAANLSSAEVTEIYQTENPAEDSSTLEPAKRDRLYQDINENHCGMLPESQFPAMMRVQQARDQRMAQALSSGNQDGPAILLAGNYHIRQDLGVPNYLSQDSLSVAWLEVSPSLPSPEDYEQPVGDGRVYDYIWFTPAIRDGDYCDEL